MPNYDFTEPAQAALHAAEEEATLLGHDHIGTEHILLGLYRDPWVRATLNELGVTSERLRAALEWSVRRGKASLATGRLPFTSRAKKVLDFSQGEAQGNQRHIAPRHLLVALFREDKGIAYEILTLLGVTAEQITSSSVGSE
jgi:ATP-dependent Clp protease ATP-binding subunit ClpC